MQFVELVRGPGHYLADLKLNESAQQSPDIVKLDGITVFARRNPPTVTLRHYDLVVGCYEGDLLNAVHRQLVKDRLADQRRRRPLTSLRRVHSKAYDYGKKH